MRILPLLSAPAIDTSAARADATDVTATPAKPARKPRKPVAAKPATPAPDAASAEHTGPVLDLTPTAPTAEAAPSAPAAEPAVAPATDTPRVAPIARTCATIAAQATNFGGVLSDRDTAYITFYAGLAKAASDGVVTVRAIADCGRRPAYVGSNKPHDAGVIVRLTKAGYLTPEADGTSFTFTDKARTSKAYAAA